MKTIENYLYDIERFGLKPKILFHRLFTNREYLPKILTVTVPKSGTNLLQRILMLHPLLYRRFLPTLGRRNQDMWSNHDKIFLQTKNGSVVSSHFDYDKDFEKYLIEQTKHKIIFMARDPRDIVISDMFYILKRNDHPYKPLLLEMANEKERLKALIQGTKEIRSIDKQMYRFIDWINDKNFYVKYEDLVGTAGGGNDVKQRKVISSLFNDYLDIKIDAEMLEYLASNARSSKTQTFRSGTINNWKTHFDDDLKDIFKEVAGDILIKMGYEKDNNW